MLSIILSLIVCLLITDFITGIGHWLEDTWLAPGKSEFLNKYLILPNIEHHRSPGKMDANNYWGTNFGTIIVASIVALIFLVFHVFAWQVYLVLFLSAHANLVHAWAHTRKVPTVVAWLQRFGILQSIQHHGLHHKRPYEARHCTFTNYLNPALDGIKFWRGLEWVGERLGFKIQRGSAARSGF